MLESRPERSWLAQSTTLFFSPSGFSGNMAAIKRSSANGIAQVRLISSIAFIIRFSSVPIDRAAASDGRSAEEGNTRKKKKKKRRKRNRTIGKLKAR